MFLIIFTLLILNFEQRKFDPEFYAHPQDGVLYPFLFSNLPGPSLIIFSLPSPFPVYPRGHTPTPPLPYSPYNLHTHKSTLYS